MAGAPRHGVLSGVLSRYLGRSFRSDEIDRTCTRCGHPNHGRPRLPDSFRGGSLEFSLSRAGDLVFVALTVDGAIGLDVEAVHRLGAWEPVAEQFFTADERIHLGRVPEQRRAYGFLTAWTVKEACLKADGRGIVAGPAAVEVLVDPASPAAPPVVRTGGEWHVVTFEPAVDHVAALATERPAHRLVGWDWESGDPELGVC